MYTSTRKKLNKNVSYCITKGISDDGGLFILDNFDGFSLKEEMVNLTYQELTKAIFTFFLNDFSFELIDKVVTIDDEDAINMSRILARKYGLGVGISSGANLIASVITGKDNVVTVFADDFKKYLSTDLTKNINFDKELISNQIEIISIENV
jgi:hypothetical protein